MDNINLKEYNYFTKKVINKNKIILIIILFLLLLIFVFKIDFYNNKKILLEKKDTYTYELNIKIEDLKYIGNRKYIMIEKNRFIYTIKDISKDNYFYNDNYYKKVTLSLNKKTTYNKNFVIYASTYEKKSIISNLFSKMKGE
ncbi:MAG: hypothetical protein PHQ64_02945 [Bacilli bacterium]|nr:hypothetical protein [Bacilli bacterium]